MQILILIHDESSSTTLNYIIVSFIIHNRDILFIRLFYLDTIDLRWSIFCSPDEYFSKIQTINSIVTFHIDFQ